MPANTTAVRICPNCDGFPVVSISTGARQSDGTLPTLPAVCLPCAGTGRIPAHRTPVLTSAGAR